MKKISLTVIVIILGTLFADAQGFKATEIKEDIWEGIQDKYGLSEVDLQTMQLSQRSVSAESGVTHYYFHQTIDGTPVHNAVLNVHILPGGKLLHSGSSFTPDAQSLTGNRSFSLTSAQAAQSAFSDLGWSNSPLEEKLENGNFKGYKKITKTLSDIPVKKTFTLSGNERLSAAWTVGLETTDGEHAWLYFIDAGNGNVIRRLDLMQKCGFGKHGTEGHICRARKGFGTKNLGHVPYPDGSEYNVFPVPVESPIHGERSLVSEPADAVASPFGWQDLNGITGRETDGVQGNNGHAYEDRDGNDSPENTPLITNPNLFFDFPFDRGLRDTGMVYAKRYARLFLPLRFYRGLREFSIHELHGARRRR